MWKYIEVREEGNVRMGAVDHGFRRREDAREISKFVEMVVLKLAPGIYLRLLSSVPDIGEEVLRNPQGFYFLLNSLLGGEEAIHFFDRMASLHVQSVTGVLPKGGVFSLLKHGEVSEFLEVVRKYLKASALR